MYFPLLFTILASLIASAVGCSGLNRSNPPGNFIPSDYSRYPGGKFSFKIDSSFDYVISDGSSVLGNMESVRESDLFDVLTHPGLVCEARRLAEFYEASVRAGLDILPNQAFNEKLFDLLIISASVVPQNLNAQFSSVRFPIFVTPYSSDAQTIRENFVSVDLMTHELVELMLLDGSLGFRTLPDIVDTENPTWVDFGGTRWFRDGLANYAALRSAAHAKQVTGMPLSDLTRVIKHCRPIADLKSVGVDIFYWANVDEPRPSGFTSRDLYSASLGIFILIEQVYGENSVALWLDSLANLSSRKTNSGLSGKDLLRNFESTFGDDLRALLGRLSSSDLELPKSTFFSQAFAKTFSEDLSGTVFLPKGELLLSAVDELIGARRFKDGLLVLDVNGEKVSTPLELELNILGYIDLKAKILSQGTNREQLVN